MERQKNLTLMADILFNKSGIPLMASGKSYLGTTTGVPAERPKVTAPPKPAQIDPDKTIIGNIELASWGPADNLSSKPDEIIHKVGVLNTGFRFTRNFILEPGSVQFSFSIYKAVNMVRQICPFRFSGLFHIFVPCNKTMIVL